jgi:hypothetical protein
MVSGLVIMPPLEASPHHMMLGRVLYIFDVRLIPRFAALASCEFELW